MEAKQALADLTEISSQIQAAVLMDREGELGASTLDDDRARRLARAAFELLSFAGSVRRSLGPEALTQLEAATLEGSVFVVRDGGRVIAATTSVEPTVGLVFYDLKSCLRSLADSPAPERPKPREKASPAASKKGDGPAAKKELKSPPSRAQKRQAEGGNGKS